MHDLPASEHRTARRAAREHGPTARKHDNHDAPAWPNDLPPAQAAVLAADSVAVSPQAASAQRRAPQPQRTRLQHVWLSSRLLIQVRSFSAVTVITPNGVIGRYEWRRLSKAIRNVGPERKCVLDLVCTDKVPGAVLRTLLAADQQGRYRGVPFIVCNVQDARIRHPVNRAASLRRSARPSV